MIKSKHGYINNLFTELMWMKIKLKKQTQIHADDLDELSHMYRQTNSLTKYECIIWMEKEMQVEFFIVNFSLQ